MSRRVQLREMTEKDFASYVVYSNEQHAADLQKEKGISKEEAFMETEEGLKRMLPNGKETPDNYLMVIERQEDSVVVGYMWYMYDHRREDTYLFLCDFFIFEEERRKGYGEEALCEMDKAAGQLSCKKCVLFVEDETMSARKLYEKCGYIYRNERENGRYMDKNV